MTSGTAAAAPRSGATAPMSFNFNFGSFGGAGGGAAGAPSTTAAPAAGAGGGSAPFRFSFPSNAVSVNHASDDDEGDEDNDEGDGDDVGVDGDDMASSMLRRLLGTYDDGAVGDYPNLESSMDSEVHRVQLAAASLVEKRIEQLYMRMQGELCAIEREEFAQAAPLLAKRSDFAMARTKATAADAEGNQLRQMVGDQQDDRHGRDSNKTHFWARLIWQLYEEACDRSVVSEERRMQLEESEPYELHFLTYITDVQFEPLVPTTSFTELDLDAKFVFHFAPNPYMMDPTITVFYRPEGEGFHFSPSAIRWKRNAPHSPPPVGFLEDNSPNHLLKSLFKEHFPPNDADAAEDFNECDFTGMEFYHLLRMNFLSLFRSVYYGLEFSKSIGPYDDEDFDEDDEEDEDDEDEEGEDDEEDDF